MNSAQQMQKVFVAKQFGVKLDQINIEGLRHSQGFMSFAHIGTE